MLELYFWRILFGVALLILIAMWVGRRKRPGIDDGPIIDGSSGETVVAVVGQCTINTVDKGESNIPSTLH